MVWTGLRPRISFTWVEFRAVLDKLFPSPSSFLQGESQAALGGSSSLSLSPFHDQIDSPFSYPPSFYVAVVAASSWYFSFLEVLARDPAVCTPFSICLGSSGLSACV